MREGKNKVWTYSLYMWSVTAAVIAFNTAAAMTHNATMTYLALALTGGAAVAGIGFGILTARAIKKDYQRP